MKWIYLLISLTTVVTRAEVRCGRGQVQEHAYEWCLDPNPRSRDVLYVFHGGGGNAREWVEGPDRKLWPTALAIAGLEMPSVITLSFGPRWLLNDGAGSAASRPLEATAREIMPALEKEIGFVGGRRMAWGWSMGSYNSSVLALRYPGLFHSIALQCPALGLFDPFAPAADLEAHISTLPKGTRPDFVRGLAAWVRDEFKTRENWARHDPMQLLRATSEIETRFFVTCTKDDEYGFFAGTERFVEVLRAKRAHVVWRPEEQGGHCAVSLQTRFAQIGFLGGLD